MGITKAIARDIPVNGVNFVEYYYRTTTEGEVPTTIHHVAVKVNKHVYIGEYSADSEANAFSLAQDVVKGLLIKNGCTRPDSRITGIKFKKYGFPSPIPLTDVTPNAVNWSDIVYNESFGEPGWTSRQITGISAPITLFASTTSPANQNLLWKVTATEPLYDSFLTGFSSSTTTLSVSNTQWVTFAYVGSEFATVTVYNQSDSNAILDTFTVDVSGVP